MCATCVVSLRCVCYMHGEFELWVLHPCMVSLRCACYMHGESEVCVLHAW